MIDAPLMDCPLCGSMQVSRWTVGKTVQCNACGCNAPFYTWQNRLNKPAAEGVTHACQPTPIAEAAALYGCKAMTPEEIAAAKSLIG